MDGAERYQECEKPELISIILEQQREVDKLRHIIKNANRQQYGKKSEKLSQEQCALFSLEAAPEPEAETVTIKEHKREIPHGRKPLPADLPRERKEYEPEERVCKCCGMELAKIGEDVTEELEYVPASFKVIEHARIKRACPRCQNGVVQGSLPDGVQPLEKRRPGAGLLTHIVLSKYVDHLPLYRQEQIFLRQGIVISRQRMCDWVGGVSELLLHLWKALKVEALARRYVQADETTIKVRDLEVLAKEEKLLTGYFWAVHGPPDIAFFEYQPSRAGESAKEVLKGFRGVVQTDAYAGYNPVLLPDEVTRLACMAHIRRKFVDGRDLAPADCDRVLKQIAKLYELEERWRGLSPEARLEERQRKAKPLFEELREMIVALSQRLLPRHGLQEALGYAINQMEPMSLYLNDGSFLIDNNPVERGIRPIALGRKNYLFAGSHDGARHAAVIYSMMACCKLNKVNPRDWLTDVLRRLPGHPVNRVAELLPHHWQKSAA